MPTLDERINNRKNKNISSKEELIKNKDLLKKI